MHRVDLTRRRLLAAAALAPLASCKVLDGARPGTTWGEILASANGFTHRVHRLIVGDALAREYGPADIRQGMRPNGVTDPPDEDYRALAAGGFADWRLTVTGAVERPLSLSLADLMAMPARRQITRHDCVEGWSCIAQWTGVPLSRVLAEARPRPGAAFCVFRCMDTIERTLSGPVRYWESIDMRDATHPQTILAWAMNGAPLPVANGAPLRLRVERQLGYKMAKYLHGIEVVESLAGLGRGSYWADRGYDWYAGI